jgi:outer membrane protein OmpA-like peptidoglycan-associated protein
MNTLKLTLCGAVTAFGLLSGSAFADSAKWMLPFYNDYSPKYESLLTESQKLDLRNYLQYEQREPCQNYQALPMNFYQDRCVIYYRYPVSEEEATNLSETSINRIVLASYTIEFAFDSSLIESQSMPVLDKIAREITTYLPSDVTVSGYTDSKGTGVYNKNLSQRRADSVSQVLTNRGVSNRSLGSQAFGETNQAVQTQDGVALRANRRVIVEFLK